jgi:hypothetical protein
LESAPQLAAQTAPSNTVSWSLLCMQQTLPGAQSSGDSHASLRCEPAMQMLKSCTL